MSTIIIVSSVLVPERHEILNHFFAQIMIDSIYLIFVEQLGQMVAQFQRTGSVSAKRFFYYNARPPSENKLLCCIDNLNINSLIAHLWSMHDSWM